MAKKMKKKYRSKFQGTATRGGIFPSILGGVAGGAVANYVAGFADTLLPVETGTKTYLTPALLVGAGALTSMFLPKMPTVGAGMYGVAGAMFLQAFMTPTATGSAQDAPVQGYDTNPSYFTVI
jgi:hypothetical protein